MGRKPIGKRAMSATQYQRRWRAKKKHEAAVAHRAQVVAGLATATEREMARLATMTKLYQLILIDPPWKVVTWSEGGMGRAVENTYPTMSLAELKALRIPAASNALMFMWTTSTVLDQSIELLTHWGFAYKGFVVWDKMIPGKGKRFRLRAELIIYGDKGRGLPIPLPVEVTDNIFTIRRSTKKNTNSEKPREFADLLVHQYAGVSRLAMFARNDVGLDWNVWGNEAPPHASLVSDDPDDRGLTRPESVWCAERDSNIARLLDQPQARR